MIHLIKKHFVLVIIGAAILIGLIFIRHQETKATYVEEEFTPIELMPKEEEETELETEASTWMVDIKGEVKKPGVYEVESSSRVHDVIDLAGGFTNKADQNFINLAQKVQDEMVIIVPKEGEELNTFTSTFQEQDDQKVKVNQATKEEIETLPGIGPAKAQAIIDYREENGMFQEVDDLLQVNGIGEKTLENLKDHVSIP